MPTGRRSTADHAPPALVPPTYLCRGRYRVLRTLGEGGFGIVVEAEERSTGNRIAVKLEPATVRINQLAIEARFYREARRYMVDACGFAPDEYTGIPVCLWHGETQGYRALALERLGPSLEHVRRQFPRGRVPYVHLLSYAARMLECVRNLHRLGYIHRDIKPGNFCVVNGGDNAEDDDGVAAAATPPDASATRVYILDFGLAKRFRLPAPHPGAPPGHIPLRYDKPVVGTMRYASLGVHYGYEASRRDDLETLVYTWIYLSSGSLPWQPGYRHAWLQRLPRASAARARVGNALAADPDAVAAPPEVLLKEAYSAERDGGAAWAACLPGTRHQRRVFVALLRYARRLGFDEAPDYDHVHALLRQLVRDE